jgi:glyoxylase-like metal-dependent hydrolase (beta-lactamase superfamily II)
MTRVRAATALLLVWAGTAASTPSAAQHQRPAAPPDRLPSPSALTTPAAGQVGVLPVQGKVYMLNLGDVNIAAQVGDDGILLVDTGPAAWSDRITQTLRDRFPGKPIRYIINTHSHFDHASGLRTYAAEGVTIVTHPGNIPYYEQLWAGPRTINPDRLAKSGRKATFEGVAGSRTFTDGVRRLVVHHYAGNFHNPGMLMVHLPKERILIEADSYTPPPTNTEAPGGILNLVHFYEAVERLRLEVEQIIPIHGRLVTMEDLRAAVNNFGNMQVRER